MKKFYLFFLAILICLPAMAYNKVSVAMSTTEPSWSTDVYFVNPSSSSNVNIIVPSWPEGAEFKIVVDGTWYGNGNTDVPTDGSSWQTGGVVKDGGNMKLNSYANGKPVMFSISQSNGHFCAKAFSGVALHGSWDSNWSDKDMTFENGVWTATNVKITNNNCEFGIKFKDGSNQVAWLNGASPISIPSSGGTYTLVQEQNGSSNPKIDPGTYDFSFNTSTNVLTVTPVSTNTVATPVIGNGAWDGDSYKVNITCATEGATIQYSTDGNNWTTGSTFTASTNEFTLYAKATKSGMDASEQTDKTIKVFSAGPSIGSFNGATVTITGAPDGATLYYSEDASSDIWTVYTGAITLPASGEYTLRAFYEKGGIQSPVSTKAENLNPLYTAFFDATGTTNFSSTANAYVYSDNGNKKNAAWPGVAMTKVSGSDNLWKYEQRLSFSPEYIIFNNGNGTQYPSKIGFAFTNGSTYGKDGLMSNVATPVISDENAELNGVTITCATDGAQIYYTFGNAAFSKTAWKAYTPGSTISTPGSAYTLRAIAVATDDEESAIATKTADERYTIFYEDSDGWDQVNVHIYKGSSNLGWPGPAMTRVEDNLWKITFRTNIKPANVIFSNNGSNQHPGSGGFAFQNGATYTASGIKPKPVELWLLGTMNNWTPSNDWKFVATTETESESGAYNLILKDVAISNVSWFKIADVTFNASTGTYDWDNINDFGNSDKFEGQCMDYTQTYTLTKKNDGNSPTNCSVKDDFTGDIKFNSTTGAIKFVYVDKGVSATLSIRHIPSYDAERGKPASKILFRIDPKDFRYTEDASGKKIWDITNIKVVVKRDLYKDFNGSVNTEIVTVKHHGIEETANLATGLNEYEGDFYIYEFDKEDGEITPDGAEYNFYINAEITGYNSKGKLVTINAMAIGGNVVPFEGLTSEKGSYPDEFTIVDNPIVFDTKFDIPVDGGIRYVRTMKATDLDKYPGTHSWQPWFMPFDVTKKEAAEFITTYTDGKLEILTLDRIEGTGDNLTAYFKVVDNNTIGDDDVIMSHNTPYIFLPKETGAHDLKFATGENETRVIYATKVGDDYVDGLAANATGWQMVGNYVQIRMGGTGEGENAGETNSYALSNGTFSKGLSSRVSYLNPFRVRLKYFGSSNPVNTKIRIARTTGATSTDEEMVNDLLEDMTSGEAVIYDMQGRRVNNPGRGMFIINGHKVVIK